MKPGVAAVELKDIFGNRRVNTIAKRNPDGTFDLIFPPNFEGSYEADVNDNKAPTCSVSSKVEQVSVVDEHKEVLKEKVKVASTVERLLLSPPRKREQIIKALNGIDQLPHSPHVVLLVSSL